MFAGEFAAQNFIFCRMGRQSSLDFGSGVE
jgi:hypothetical protein